MPLDSTTIAVPSGEADATATPFDLAVAALARLTPEQLGRMRLVVIPALQREKRGVEVRTKPSGDQG